MSGSGETILVVEDNADLQLLAEHVLKSAGYVVLTAGDAELALQVAAGQDGPIHLLFVDATLPGMQGPELAQRLVALRPEMKVLHTSGYTDDAVLRHGVASNSVQFLGKPWSIGDLRRKVREVLDG